MRGVRLVLALVLAAFFALAATPTVLAQSAATGAIEGRVSNAGNSKYLNNARIRIEGTNRETLTNEYGEYRFADVPVGDVKVQAFYTGLDGEALTVKVTPGAATTQNFDLTSADRYGTDKTIKMDAFVVTTNKEFEGKAIAQNEQRFAPNIKNVIAADAFGDVTEGNPGEFLKYLPGVTVNYVAADVRTVNIRGFADVFTNVSVDGMRLTSSVSGNSNRVFEFEQVSLNNVARVEVTKVPTPADPADSLGGSVNMISKNAFERKGTQFNYRAYFNFSSEDTDIFKKTGGPAEKKTYKVLPGFDFDYTVPVSKTFGFVITGLSSNQFNEQHRWNPTWNFAQAGATPTNPYLQSFQLQDGPKNTFRDSVSVKADWKITSDSVISAMVQNSYYDSFFGNRNLNFNIGTNAVPTPSTGQPLTFGPDFVNSATGRATVTQGGSFRNKLGDTLASNFVYRYNGRLWDVDAAVHAAQSRSWIRDLNHGHWESFNTALQGVSQVKVSNIAFPNFNWVALDAAGNSIDYNNLSNYRISGTRNRDVNGKAKMHGGLINIKRDIEQVSFPLAIRFGVASRTEDKDNRRAQNDYIFVGADGVANTADDAAAPFLDPKYINQAPGFGQPAIQWGSPYSLATLFQQHPEFFRLGAANTAVGVTAETFRIANSQHVKETVSAGYAQVEAKLFKNKLNVIAGVRYEKTKDSGEGALVDPDAVFQRNANGTYVDGDSVTAGIQRVRRTDAGVAGSLQELSLTNKERGYHASNSYDSYNPSLHLTYEITDNLLLRLAYARTIGRPDYNDIIPTATIDEDNNDPSLPGTIVATNPGLKPWYADNFDLSLEYYFSKSGMVSVGAFKKDLHDFWTNVNTTLTAGLATQLSIDPAFIGWQVTSKANAGTATIQGIEASYTQQLRFLPGYGRYLALSVNGTALHLTGPNGGDFNGFISRTANVSLSWNKKPFTAIVTWNYRGRQKGQNGTTIAAQTGAQYGATTGFNELVAPRYNVDINLGYELSKRIQFFMNARNITNQPQVLDRSNSVSPGYANKFRQEEFGVQYSVGVKGTF